MIYDIVQNNFTVVVNVLLILLFLKTNTLLRKEVISKIWISAIMVIILIVVENVELWAASLAYPTMLRVVMSIIGYTIRPVIVLLLILIVYPGRTRYHSLIYVPAIVNGLIVSTAIFSDVAFSYNELNEFVRGPLGFSAYVCSGIYLFLILIYSMIYFKEKDFVEAGTVFAIVFMCILATVIEVAFKHVGLLRSVIMLGITFYYLYLYTQFFKKDALTGALNRQCFYGDSQKNREQLTAVIAMDLNNLKKINDEQGHEAGDKAICAVVDATHRCLARGFKLYRTGGDEFIVLCWNKDLESVSGMIDCIREEIRKTPYNCAIGMAAYDGAKNFNEVCAMADENMYENKRSMKKA